MVGGLHTQLCGGDCGGGDLRLSQRPVLGEITLRPLEINIYRITDNQHSCVKLLFTAQWTPIFCYLGRCASGSYILYIADKIFDIA